MAREGIECVRGWSSEGEIVGSEWGEAIDGHRVTVDWAELVAPELLPLTRTNNSYVYLSPFSVGHLGLVCECLNDGLHVVAQHGEHWKYPSPLGEKRYYCT